MEIQVGREYHVSIQGSDLREGSINNPFRTISKAASVAVAGDTVIVHGGVYREWVKPENAGESDSKRIIYKAADGENVVIKGSEHIQTWKRVEASTWKCEIDNAVFGDYNPYEVAIEGDWFLHPENHKVHAGEVYLNGKSFYESPDLEGVINPRLTSEDLKPSWLYTDEEVLDAEDVKYRWFAEVNDQTTIIYANFHEADPNAELTEINVRKACFYPTKTRRNYITVKGFEMAQAATPWTPPTSDQVGLIGVNWSKGWIIEDNIIHDSKCSAISLGKEGSTGHMLRTRTNRKSGYQYQLESAFQAYKMGWSKDNIGSHIIRNNEIYNCGQNAIVGNLGCAFSKITNNHIYNIGVKHEFFGYEIAGIKLHAPIDTEISENNIHDCTLGTWLDWQAQGTRINRNLFYNNGRDLYIEVTHGPHIVDNNIFASPYSFDNSAQGGAYINNLFLGSIRKVSIIDRATPYHYPHSTDFAGYAFVHGGDDRVYQNIYLGGDQPQTEESSYGTLGYVGHLSSLDEYKETINVIGKGDHEVFNVIKDPVYINNNAYLKGAQAFDREVNKIESEFDPVAKIEVLTDGTYITLTMPEKIFELKAETLNSEKLGTVRIVEAPYDNANGDEIIFEEDYFGQQRGESGVVGPFRDLKPGLNRFKVWTSME